MTGEDSHDCRPGVDWTHGATHFTPYSTWLFAWRDEKIREWWWRASRRNPSEWDPSECYLTLPQTSSHKVGSSRSNLRRIPPRAIPTSLKDRTSTSFFPTWKTPRRVNWCGQRLFARRPRLVPTEEARDLDPTCLPGTTTMPSPWNLTKKETKLI